MSFDKTKFLRNAERFLAQGKVRAAIGEYKRIVENDPKDFSTLNILGDLHVKVSETKEAVKCYTAVAEHYGNQGFTQKAIAIYNKILRITPDSPEISLKLAQFYQLKGSPAEARFHYSNLAEYYRREGRRADALAVWKQIAELDPNNTEIYLKIGESCLQDGDNDEACNAFIEAGNRFTAKKLFEKAMSAFSKALELKPQDLAALNGLVKAQMGMGFTDDAAKTLENILEKQPYNREILYMLADCHLDANNPSEAEKAIIKLVEQEPANYRKFLDLVQSYLRNGDLLSASRVLAMTSEHLLVGGESEDLGKWINEILARNPEQVEALRLLVRFHSWQRDEVELKSALERLAEAARASDSVEDERYALSQLVLMSPQEVGYAQRLQELNEKYGYWEAPVEPQASYPAANEVPTFESFAIVENNAAPEQNYLTDYAEFKPDVSFGSESYAGDSLYQNSGTNDFAFEESGQNFDFSGEMMTQASVNGYDTPENAFSNGQVAEQNAPVRVETPVEKVVVDEAKLRDELETIEYYAAQGYVELALNTLDSLVEKYGELPEIQQARINLENQYNQTPDENQFNQSLNENQFSRSLDENQYNQALNENQFDQSPVNEPVAAETSSASAEEKPKPLNPLEDFRDELGLEDNETEQQSDFETPYQLGIAYKEMGLMEEAIRQFQEAVKLVSPTDGTKRFFHCCNLLGHCFMEKGMPNIALMWYRRGLETEGLNEEELQGLRYEIANAYEAGGEPHRAVELFEQIYAVNVEYRDVSERLSQLHSHH